MVCHLISNRMKKERIKGAIEEKEKARGEVKGSGGDKEGSLVVQFVSSQHAHLFVCGVPRQWRMKLGTTRGTP